MMDWISQNIDWIFEGIGVFILGLLVSFLIWVIKRKNANENGKNNQTFINNIKGRNVTLKNNTQSIIANENKVDK